MKPSNELLVIQSHLILLCDEPFVGGAKNMSTAQKAKSYCKSIADFPHTQALQ